MPEWTQTQREAIFASGTDLLCGAGAGSGKTSVLVERVFRILTDPMKPVPADRILCMTFTKAAANELRQRLEKRLAQELRARPSDRLLRQQTVLIGRAVMGTIHSFCSRILKEYWFAAGLSADFSVVDEIREMEVRETAMQTALDRLYEDGESGFALLCSQFGRSRTDSAGVAAILSYHNFLSNIEDPDSWETDFESDLENGRAAEALESAAIDMIRGWLKDAASLLNAAEELAATDEICAKNCLAALADDKQRAADLLSLVKPDALLRALAAMPPFRAFRRFKGADPAAAEKVKKMRERAKKEFAAAGELAARISESDSAQTLQYFRALKNARRVFLQELEAIKHRKKILAFEDLERKTQALLRDETLRDEIAGRFDAIFVDEFQDVNAVQFGILKLLTEGRKNLFGVGDVKQSIYRFRRAEPEIFLSLRARANEDPNIRYISLCENFRSGASVIKAINGVFLPLMREALGGTDYRTEKLIPSEFASTLEDEGMLVRVVESEQPDAAERETARLIRRMINEGYEIDTPQGPKRCREGDFCILLRKAAGRASEYQRALEAEGLRADVGATEDFFRCSEIETVIGILALLDNSSRDVEAAAALMSPLFGFTPDDMAALRLKGRRESISALLAASEEPKCREAAARFAAWRTAAVRCAPDELIGRILDETDAELLLCAGNEMESRARNLRVLLDFASSAARAGYGLSAFLRICRRAREGGKSPIGNPPPSGEAVAISTVHGAKGLEWPIVIFADADRMFNRRDAIGQPVLFDRELGVGFRTRLERNDGIQYSKKTLRYALISETIDARIQSEQVRLLYVALTRAKQKLIVVCQKKDHGDAVADWQAAGLPAEPALQRAAQNPLLWILGGIRQSFETEPVEFDNLREWSEGPVRIVMAPPEEESDAVREELLTDDTVYDGIAEQLRARAAFRYPHAPLTELPSKSTVSGLAEGGAGTLYTPAFTRAGRLSGAERGSAMHLFLQCADYTLAAQDPTAEIERMVAGGWLDRRAADALDTDKLQAFFDSSLFARMQAGTLLREYEFIDTIDATELGASESAPVVVQGIADCVLIEPDGALIIDYKTDRVTNFEQLRTRYAAQLALYKRAIGPRLGIPVKGCLIYSFALGIWQEV